MTPEEVTRAAELFHRDGFVAVRAAIKLISRANPVRAAEVIETLVAADPESPWVGRRWPSRPLFLRRHLGVAAHVPCPSGAN